jgi:HEAT repeat protein
MSLSSLIVQREIATIRQVEEALARQVLYGGDLVTNLLEVAKLDEATLTRLLAESFGLPAAAVGALPTPSDKVRALLPVDIAVGRAVVPLGIDDGALVVAVPEPFGKEVEYELRAAVGVPVMARIAPMVRIREALARMYGAPLERRLQRLLTRLGTAEAGFSVPPSLAPPPPSDMPTTMPTAPRKSTIPLLPAVEPPPPAANPTRATRSGFPAPIVMPPPSRGSSKPPRETSARRSLIQRDAAQPTRPLRRRRGPITPDVAKKELEEAPDRDAMLDLFFDYSRQYFDYSALFVVHGDIAEGRDAYGDGASRDRVTGIGVPLDLPSVLSQARDQRAPVQTELSPDGLDPVLLGDLQRKTSGEVLIAPIVVRTRTVALFYGDSGDHGVDSTAVKEVVTFAFLVGQAFEKLIVRKKLQGFLASGPGAPVAAKVDPQLVVPKAVAKSPLAESMPPPSAPAHVPEPALEPTPRMGFGDSEAPPPDTAVAVRRPQGRPIPREEPDLDSEPDPFPSVPAPPAAPIPPAPDSEPTIHDYDARPTPAPPSSESIAIAPRRPPSARMATPGVLPSVIVDVDREFGAMVDKVIAHGGDDAAEAELLRQGAHAMPALMTRFPGPTAVDRTRAEEGTMRVAECGPVLRLIAGQRRVAVPFVLPYVADADPERRYWATLLLTELPYAEVIDALVPRLFDGEASVRRVARLAARAVGEAAPDTLIDRLGKHFNDPAAPATRRIQMLDTLGELRERLAVPILIAALSDPEDDVIAAARRALMTITRQDYARDVKKWGSWWHANAARHRIEWLIDALMHEVPAVRRAAGDELKAITKEYFGYYDDLPKRERERAQQRYRDWWNTEGRLRFRRV